MPVQTFATPASLYAEQVADLSAGGTGYFGAEVVVGGITWKWGGKYYAEAAPGSPSNPFTSAAELLASLPSGPSDGVGGTAWYLGGTVKKKAEWRQRGSYTYWAQAKRGTGKRQIVGLLGDSIVSAYSSALVQAAAAIGKLVGRNSAVGGTFIQDQAAKIPDLISANCTEAWVQVGTNNAIPGADTSTFFGLYCNLFKELDAAGFDITAIMIPPKSYVYGPYVYAANNAMYYAARLFGAKIYSPWEQFAVAGGGWSISTLTNDSTHPVESGHATAAATLVTLIQSDKEATPLVRSSPDSLIVGPTFRTDTNADGVSDGWVSAQTGSTASWARVADGANDHWFQQSKLTNPVTNDVAKVYQEITTGFVPGDLLVLRGNLSMTTPDGTDNKVYGVIEVKFYNAGGSVISSVFANNNLKQCNGTGRFDLDFTPPVGTTKLRIEFGLFCLASATGVFILGVSRPGLLNLTGLGISSEI